DALAASDLKEGLDLSEDNLRKFFDVFKKVDIKSIEDLEKAFEQLPDDITLSAEAIEAFRLAWLQMQYVPDEIDEITDSVEELRDEYEETIDSLKSLASAYETLNKGEQLSADTLLDLIDKY